MGRARSVTRSDLHRLDGRTQEICSWETRIPIPSTDMGMDPEMYGVTFRILESEDEHFYENERFGYHWALNGFELPEEILEKVYSQNAKKLYKSL